MTQRVIEGSYARLVGLRNSVDYHLPYLPAGFGDDYTSVLSRLRNTVSDPFEGFDLGKDCDWDRSMAYQAFNRTAVLSKINQLISYLELVHAASTKIVQIGSAYNLNHDSELKSRCADLLSATSHFDRVINQSTQVLEERIRALLPELKSDYGQTLVSKAMNPESSRSRIQFSDNPGEQEGYVALFRGVVGAFRNPSHHRFLENMTREQALQICAFADNLLALLRAAEVKPQAHR